MRSSVLLSVAAVFVVGMVVGAGCYNPPIKNKGFSCSPDVENSCPSGFYCVDGLCQDKPGTSSGTGGVGGDAGVPQGGDMSAGPAHGGDDLAMADLAKAQDMAKQCRPANTSCLVDADCCSMSCDTLFGCR